MICCNGTLTRVVGRVICSKHTEYQEHICCVQLWPLVWVVNVCLLFPFTAEKNPCIWSF